MEIALDRKIEKKMTRRHTHGQGVVEVVFLLPPILLLVFGTFYCIRSSILDSAAESATHAEAIRYGRRLAGIEREMSFSILPDGKNVRIQAENRHVSFPLPIPFPDLAGRTIGRAYVDWNQEDSSGIRTLPSLHVCRKSEMSVDCWDRPSDSGNNLRKLSGGMVITGGVR